MSTFLLDANLSPQTRRFLVDTFRLDVIDLLTERQSLLSDEDVVALAKREQRVIITLDVVIEEHRMRVVRPAD